MSQQVYPEPGRSGKGKQAAAVASILIVTAIWGASFVFLKNALEDISPFYFLFLRFSLAALVLAVICGPQKLKRIRLTTLGPSLLIGAALCSGFLFQTRGLPHTTVSNAAFIMGSYVVMVPLVNWFFIRKISPAQLGFAALALVGLAILSLNEALRLNSGDLWCLLGAVGFTLHFVLLERYTQKLDSLLLTLLQLAACALICGLLALLFEQPPGAANFTGRVWYSLFYLALLSTALAYLVQTAAQKILPAAQTSVLFTAEALFAAFFGWLLLDELFTGRQFAGAGIMLVSIFGTLLWPYWRQKRGLPPSSGNKKVSQHGRS